MSDDNLVKNERGMITLEFALASSAFFMLLIAVVAGGSFFWTQSALVEATRRGARYATNQCQPGLAGCLEDSGTADARIKNVVVYGTANPADGDTPFIPNLTSSNVAIERSNNFGVGTGTVTVSITDYEYNFSVPGVQALVPMPACRTTFTGENAGFVPANN